MRSNTVSMCLSAGEVSVRGLASWRQQVRGHDPHSPRAPRVNALIPTVAATHCGEIKPFLFWPLTVCDRSCVLFIHWSVEVSGEGTVTPKIDLLTKIPERGKTIVWLRQFSRSLQTGQRLEKYCEASECRWRRDSVQMADKCRLVPHVFTIKIDVCLFSPEPLKVFLAHWLH